MGRLGTGRPPVLASKGIGDPQLFTDPVPQALVLTAIVISFATTALFLVVLLAARGLTGTDHVDGREPDGELDQPAFDDRTGGAAAVRGRRDARAGP